MSGIKLLGEAVEKTNVV